MGATLKTLTTFFVCQILLFGSIGGLPFASISAIPSLTSSESSSTDDSTSHIILVNNESIIPTSSVSTSSPKHFQFFIGLPLGSENNLLPIEGTENDESVMADAWTINLPASINIQPNVILQNPVSEPTSSPNDVTLDTTAPIASTTTSNSVLTIIPKINIDSVSNGLKRELRDTICATSEEQCSSNNNFPLTPFSSFPSVSQVKPIFPSMNMPCARCDSEDTSNLSNSVECDCSLYNSARCSSLFTNVNPTPNTLAFDSSNNIDPYFNELQNYLNSRQSVQCYSSDIQNQPNVDPNISPSDMIRLNNNLMKAKALQNNMFTSQTVNNDANCENSINPNIMAEYQNVLRIRNDVIPKMLSENVAVKSIAQCNEDNIGCPQIGTVSAQNNMPYIQNNNVANNICKPVSNLDIARTIKDNMNDNNNNNQGCPQLRSIPIYNKESLLNKQALASSTNYDDCSQNQNNNICLGQVINQNNQGCPQLLNIAQNNLYQRNNNDANINVENSQICNCENEWTQNNNCNCVQMFTPNENLAQALQMINIEKSKRTQAPAASINILPIGETLLDGQPIGNNFISLNTLSCPAQLPSCTCSGPCNSNKLTLQDLSVPISIAPSNPISFCSLEASVPSSTNIMLAPSVNSINTISPMMTNIAPSVPNIAIANSQSPQSFVQSLIFNQDSFCNNNIQSLNPIITPTFIPIQSLPQGQFFNNIPSSTISVIPSFADNCNSPINNLPSVSLSLADTCNSPISNLPSICTSLQPMVTPSYPLIQSNLNQAGCMSGASAAITPINKIVNSLTKNIMSNLLANRLPAPPPPAKLPPVNPYNSNLITESAPILPIFDIPVACNEYVPPMYRSIVPISTFNPNLFCVEPGACDTCVPFPLSLTDAFYPESSFMSVPALTSDSSCLCGSLITPFNLPQASSVFKINNAINMCS